MALRRTFSPISKITSWLDKRASNYLAGNEDKKDIQYVKRQEILARIKQAGIVERKEFKFTLGEDIKPFVYKVVKVEKNTGMVFLKNERGTMRKISVFDKVFGIVEKRKK